VITSTVSCPHFLPFLEGMISLPFPVYVAREAVYVAKEAVYVARETVYVTREAV